MLSSLKTFTFIETRSAWSALSVSPRGRVRVSSGSIEAVVVHSSTRPSPLTTLQVLLVPKVPAPAVAPRVVMVSPLRVMVDAPLGIGPCVVAAVRSHSHTVRHPAAPSTG